MGLQYLNSADSGSSAGKDGQKKAERTQRLRRVRALLVDLPTSGQTKLSRQDAAKAYAIIVEQLLQDTPPLERRDMVWHLAQGLPRCFFPVIEDIVRNCA